MSDAPHSLENVGSAELHAVNVEIKNTPAPK